MGELLDTNGNLCETERRSPEIPKNLLLSKLLSTPLSLVIGRLPLTHEENERCRC